MPRWVIEENEDQRDSSSSEDEEEEEEEEELQDNEGEQVVVSKQQQQRHGKITIPLRGGGAGDRCHVCGKLGHRAGFVGAVYMDCPNKPCYLCKQPGHTTATCPHKLNPGLGCSQAANLSTAPLLAAVAARERGAGPPPHRPRLAARPPPRYQVEAAVLKLHSRRVTCLEFPPNSHSLVISGDKKGQLAVWDFERVHERTVYSTVHTCMNNAMRFLPKGDGMSCATASSDGTVKVVDVETGCTETLLDLNPGGWVQGESSEKNWGMLYALDVLGGNAGGAIAAGDTFGRLHVLDPRCKRAQVSGAQLHKKASKITSLHCNPADANLLLSAGGDHFARLSDVRRLPTGSGQTYNPGGQTHGGGLGAAAASPGPGSLGDDNADVDVGAGRSGRGGGGGGGGGGKRGGAPEMCGAEVACWQHGRVVNSAYFSPLSGDKVLTTCQDNRLRVWDTLYSYGGPPSREVVHSNDFSRYLTPFRAEWDPKDHRERNFVVGRYISEDFGGLALHPIDLIDASTGRLLAQLVDANLPTICPVNRFHPSRDLLISGSSRSLYVWRPPADDEEEEGEAVRGGTGGACPSSSGQQLPGRSSTYFFVDADGDADDRKKAKRSAGTAAAAACDKGQGGDGDDDGDDAGGGGGVLKKGKNGKRPAASVADGGGGGKRGGKGGGKGNGKGGGKR